MPTQTQVQELIDETNNEWTTIDGVAGIKFINKTDSSKYIFIPAAGYFNDGYRYGKGSDGYVWSSSLYTSVIDLVYNLSLDSSDVVVDMLARFNAWSVRGVKNV